MDGQDWEPVVIRKKPKTGAAAKTEASINQARQAGAEVETVKKFAAGSNRQRDGALNARKIEEETEEFRHETVSISVARKIQQARQAKGLSQKDLATRINEKAVVINQYETGKAIPSQAVLAKLERALGVKLRGGPKPKRAAGDDDDEE